MVKKTKFKCTAISDTHTRHSRLPRLPGGDFLFHTGDSTFFGQPGEVETFLEWFSKQKYTHKIFLAGNHDIGFEPSIYGMKTIEGDGDLLYFRGMILKKNLQEKYRQQALDKGIIYLDKEGIELDGVNIYGIPDQPAFCGWAFNYDREGDIAEKIFSKIPKNTDVLMTHGPPSGILDGSPHGRLGCPELRKAVDRIKPKVHIFGHIHERYGVEETEDTKFINACSLQRDYETTNKPVTFTIDKKIP